MCEEKFALLEANKNKWDRDTMGPLNASWRDFYNVYDYNNSDAGFHPWEAAFMSFEEIMQNELDKQTNELFPWALDGGDTIEFKGREKEIGGGRKYIEPQIPDFFPRESYPETTLDEVIQFDQCVRFSTYEQIAADHFGMEQVETTATETADARKEEPPSRTRTRNTSRTREPKDTGGDRRRSSVAPADDSPFKDPDNKCPSGYKFGLDCNQQPECQQCPDENFDECVALQDDLTKGKTDKEPEPPAGLSTHRTRTRTSDSAKDAPSTGRRRRT
jgi:hypothetical protein